MIALLSILFVVALATNPTYIVVYEDETAIEELHAHISILLGSVEQATYVYTTVLKGFAAPLSPEALLAAQAHPKFKFFEEDARVFAYGARPAACEQWEAGSWGLSRISAKAPRLDGIYSAPSQAGGGVTAYIVDTGIYVEHNDFEGRAVFGWKASPSWSNTDGNGHGTHVASTVGGRNWGVAKHVSLVAVKVLGDDGSGTNAGVIAGVDWAAAEQRSNNRPSVANLSLGGGFSAALNAAVTAAMKGGLFMVVAAGNDNIDACSVSPASAKDVITVGATEEGAGTTPDVRSYFSNYGVCVDIFAPGSAITAAWIGAVNSQRTISGTSMASPHVCGVAALILSTDNSLSWNDITSLLLDSAGQNYISMNCNSQACRSSPNLMLYNGCNH